MRIRTQFCLAFIPLVILAGVLASWMAHHFLGSAIATLEAGLGVVGLGALLLVAALWTLKRLLRPMEELAHASEDISQGLYGTMVPVSKSTELEQLIKAFNRMSVILRAKTSALDRRAPGTRAGTPADRKFPVSELPIRMSERPRVLFFSESVTLAHVARPMSLAKSLDPTRYDVLFACDPRFMNLFGKVSFPFRPIHSMPSSQFLNSLKKVSPLYDARTLRAYVKEDLDVIREFRPDLIISDFRLSLSISAASAHCPTMQITNVYWNSASTKTIPLLDEKLAPRFMYELGQPAVLAWHRWSMNRLRKEHGLPPLKAGIGQSQIWADHVLYSDIPEMMPISDLPPTHHYLGPIHWSPSVSLPVWWDQLPSEKPVVYVGLGSSGEESALSVILQALAELPISVMVATGGHPLPAGVGRNVYAADYLPGDQAATRANLVICNGGSPATQQALTAGVPVLGVTSNVDQGMNMEAVCRTRAGEMIAAESVTVEDIRRRVTQIFEDPSYTEAASRLSKILQRYDATERFRGIVDGLFAPRHKPFSAVTSDPL
jgi:UDP:flavonoid glycosyltransferase YjiC (YdhE family)/HAMP domain-containing protein